jgi:serine/threonine-protein kinase
MDASDPKRPDMIGRVLSDRYRIDGVIASGSFGSVYRGAHLHMHKQVAIKILHPEVENFPELVERFEREAVAGAHISHPNVAVASDLGKFDGDSYFLVQEYVPGETLREAMKRGPMPAERAAYIARQIAEGLAAAHRHKIVHRDLKPANIMLVEGSNDFVKLIDFGFARVPVEDLPHVPQGHEGPQWEMSQAGVVFGSVSYMAPDAFLGMQNVDERADLYALGLILYEMLAGRHPFDVNLPAAALFELQRNAKPPPLRELNPECDAFEDLEWVITRLLAKAPEERYQDAGAVAAAIDGAMRGIQGFMQRRESHRPPAAMPSRSMTAPPIAVREPRRAPAWWTRIERPWLYGAAVALVAVIGAIVVVLVSGEETAPPASPLASASLPAPSSKPPAPPVSQVRAAPSKPDPRREFLAAEGSAAAELWLGLVRSDEDALNDAEVGRRTVKLLADAEPQAREAGKVFEHLAYGAGTVGLDLLYRLLEEHPESSMAQRAAPVLTQQAIAGRASPALAVTLDLRRMNCSRKIQQFDRAAEHGDERTLRELEKLHPPGCVVQRGACCFKDDSKLESTLAQIRQRHPPSR